MKQCGNITSPPELDQDSCHQSMGMSKPRDFWMTQGCCRVKWPACYAGLSVLKPSFSSVEN